MSDPIDEYIQAHRAQYRRVDITQQLVAAGHDPIEVETAWNRLENWNVQPGLTPDQTRGPVVVRTYRAKNQVQAAQLFQADAAQMAAAGYFPVSQSWAQGQWGCGVFLISIVLWIVLIGFVIFLYLLVVKPDGTLTVTYQLRAAAP